MRRVVVFIDWNNFQNAVNTLCGEVQWIDFTRFAQSAAKQVDGFLLRMGVNGSNGKKSN